MVASRPPPIHPDIITTRLFPTVALVPSKEEDRGSIKHGTPLETLRRQIQKHNAASTRNLAHLYLVLVEEPKYAQGSEPSLALLQKYNAPRKMLTSARSLAADTPAKLMQHPNATAVPRQQMYLPPMPQPWKEPVVRIMTGGELKKLQDQKLQAEKNSAKRDSMSKEIQITWTIAKNDLELAFKNARSWFQAGYRVTFRISRKKPRQEPPIGACVEVIESLQKFTKSIPGVVEEEVKSLYKKRQAQDVDEKVELDPMLAVGHAMIFRYSPPKNSGKKAADVLIKIPWRINEGSFKLHIKTLASALKKGKSVCIEMVEGADTAKVKNELTAQDIFQRIQSTCRQAKDAKITSISGSVGDPDMAWQVQAGLSRSAERHLELDTNAMSAELKLRMQWITEWLQAQAQVIIYPSATSSHETLSYLQANVQHLCSITTEKQDDSTEVRYRLIPNDHKNL